MFRNLLALTTFFILSIPSTQAIEATFSSGPKQVQLLELYTSEGCSSCPPAERWLKKFKNDSGLWTDIIPIALHVDYWDRLGWPDPYARKANTYRQRDYRDSGFVNSVYTPGFIVAGREWRGWFWRSSLPDAQPQAGNLTVELKDNQLTARYDNPAHKNKPLQLNVAVLGFDLTTQVKAGENRGKALTHDFVALNHQVIKTGSQRWQTQLNLPTQPGTYGLVAWVDQPGDLTPLQATGGWLPFKAPANK